VKKNTILSKGSKIPLANSISSEYNVLRAWVLPSLMEILSNNKHHEYPQKIFTIGTIFKKNACFGPDSIGKNCDDRPVFTPVELEELCANI